MNDNDKLHRFLFENVSVRGEIVRLHDSFQTITQQHDYPPLIRQLLGQALVAVSLLTAIIKNKGRVTVQFQGKGKLKLLLAQCNDECHLRGLAQYEGETCTEEDIQSSFQHGLLTIMIDQENTGKRYQGIVPWQGKSLAESIEGYFRDSEQLPTKLWLAVDDQHAAGLLLQIMPKETTGKQSAAIAENNHEWEHVLHLTNTVTSTELLQLSHETILHRLYFEEPVRIFKPHTMIFHCTCSVERAENALLLLGRDEVEAELKDKQVIVVTCEFCNKEIVFDRVDVTRIFMRGSASGTQAH